MAVRAPTVRIGPLVAVGRTSDVYEYGSGAVVKVPRPGTPEHWARSEAEFTSAVRSLGAPAPAVHEVVVVDGRESIVFSRVRGPSMWDVLRDGAHPPAAVGRQLADVHRVILNAGLPTTLLALIERMRAKINDVRRFSEAEKGEARRAAERLPLGAALLHGDLHPGNVLLGRDGPVVIDWFDAAIGHPVADVVRTSLLIRPLARAVDRPHIPGLGATALRELHEAYVEAISDVLAPARDELAEWEAVVAATRLSEEAEADDSPLLRLWRQHATDRLDGVLGTRSGRGE